MDLGNIRKTDHIPIEKITQVPIAMFVGDSDILADQEDAEWTRDQIPSVFKYQVIQGGHETFIVGKDMQWFTRDVMAVLKEYQPNIANDYYLPKSSDFSWLQRLKMGARSGFKKIQGSEDI